MDVFDASCSLSDKFAYGPCLLFKPDATQEIMGYPMFLLFRDLV